jgi:cell division transport system permease protein
MQSQESHISKLQLRSSYLTTIISISLVLFMLGLLGFLLFKARSLSDYVKENIGFSVIIKDDINLADIKRVEKEIASKKYVKATRYIDKETATREFQKDLGEDFVEIAGYNPIPASIEVHLVANYANNDSITRIKQNFESIPEVSEVIFDKSLLHVVNDNIKKMSLVLLGFSALLLLVALALINNTIRLSVYARRFIINTMKLVGATRGFIRRPFLLKSSLHGLYASFISMLLLTGVIYLSEKNGLGQIIGFNDVEMIVTVYLSLLAIGLIITLLSTFFAVHKFLRLDTDQLYY